MTKYMSMPSNRSYGLGSLVFAPHPEAPPPEGAVRLGIAVLDDKGLIRVWEVVRAQDLGSGLAPEEADYG
jgi:hypothetical protein